MLKEYVSGWYFELQQLTFGDVEVLEEECRHLLTTAAAFGSCRYERSPQGISIGPDAAQEAMENIFQHLEDVTPYFDDVPVFSDSWEEQAGMLHSSELHQFIKATTCCSLFLCYIAFMLDIMQILRDKFMPQFAVSHTCFF